MIERGRQGEQAERQQACQKMQVGDAEEDRGHDRHLADDHGVEARRVEIEKPLAPGDLDEERRAVDEEAPALPAMPECQPPDQTDRRSVGNCCRWHAQACGLYRTRWRGRKRVPACGVEKALLARRRMRGSTMLSWEKIDAIPGWFMFQSYCVWRALLDQQARVTGRPVRDRRVARPLGVGARLLSQGRRETLSVRPQARRAGGASRHPLGRRRAGQHRAIVGPVGRPAGQARPQGHAPDACAGSISTASIPAPRSTASSNSPTASSTPTASW